MPLLHFESRRLNFQQFQLSDVYDVYECISPMVAKFMQWDPPSSLEEYKSYCEYKLSNENENEFSFVVRLHNTSEYLGITAIENLQQLIPEIGLWIKESAQGQGYGKEIVGSLIKWASEKFGKNQFLYPVAIQNIPSRKIAESLGGSVVETRQTKKYDAVVYNIPNTN